MKKISFVLSLVVISTLLLAACTSPTGSVNGNETPDIGTGETGGLADGTPTTDAGAGGTVADATPTVDAGAGSVADATATVDTGAVGVDTPDTERTPTLASGSGPGAPSTPVGGRESVATFVLLSDLITGRVEMGDRTQVGTIEGVVVTRPIAATGATTGSGSDSGTVAQATPTSDIGKGTVAGTTDGTASIIGGGPRIDYVLVNATAEAGTAQTGDAAAVPWEAFVLTATDPVVSEAGADPQQFALILGVDPAAFADAPRFADGSTFAQGWDTDAQAYWSNQGLSIPATGPTAAEGEPVVIRDTLSTMNVMHADGQSFGQVTDFVVDLTTSELAYAVISGSDANAGNFYAVPVSHFQWSGDAAMGGMGEFSANFPQTAFDSAPSFTSLDELDLSSDWSTEIDTYWQSAGGNQ